MFEKYLISSLMFMKVKSKNDNYYYLGMTDYSVGRVYIPTLNKSFPLSDITFGECLTCEFVHSKTKVAKKIYFSEEEYDVFYQQRSDLNNSDIRIIEKCYNNEKKPSKPDPRFFR